MKLTNKYQRIPLAAISVDRNTRQRKDLQITEPFLASIRQRGVLNPVIVQKNANGTFLLIAGERRFTASQQIGLLDIPVRFLEDLDPIEAQIIELEENLCRVDLTWRDQVSAIYRVHELYKEIDPDWTAAKTAENIAVLPSSMVVYLRVGRSLDDPRIANAASMSAAYNLLIRQDDRQFTSVMDDVMIAVRQQTAPPPTPIAEPIETPTTMEAAEALVKTYRPDISGEAKDALVRQTFAAAPSVLPTILARPNVPAVVPPVNLPSIIGDSFLDWAPQYDGRRFNFLHCDFPYGINFNVGSQGGRNGWSGYDDSPDVFWDLCKCLCENRDRLLAASSHIMFWFSMDYYTEIFEFFRQNWPELRLQGHPLYWHKTDNVGVLPDPARGPRRVVETALIGSIGDRKIVKASSNAYGAPTDKSIHQSTKPEPMLRYFFGMFVDQTTRMLDPTCGSGAALRAAESLGAEQVFGLEINDEHRQGALQALEKFRRMRKALG